MLKVLVTGSSGFIGSRIATYFSKKGDTVLGWDMRECRSTYTTHAVNMLDPEKIAEELALFRPDVVIHCAGAADVSKSVKDPETDYEHNVSLTHHLLFGLHHAGLDSVRFVFLSSAGVYGNPGRLPISENACLNPLSPYAVHKVMCEELCRYFARNYGTDVRIARVFSAYGAGLKKQLLWDMYRNTEKTGQLCLFGTGDESRDYIHVDDLVQAISLLTDVPVCPRVVNVANGEEVTIRSVARLFAQSVEMDETNIRFNGVTREGDPLNWRADIQRLTELGYRKTVDMETGIKEYIRWARAEEGKI